MSNCYHVFSCRAITFFVVPYVMGTWIVIIFCYCLVICVREQSYF